MSTYLNTCRLGATMSSKLMIEASETITYIVLVFSSFWALCSWFKRDA